jgi:hypothetical protein
MRPTALLQAWNDSADPSLSTPSVVLLSVCNNVTTRLGFQPKL